MESSVLRFLQLALCDLRTLSADGVPTRVDLELVKRRVKDADARAFFQEHPDILPAEAYKGLAIHPGRGFAARERWAALVTGKPFFTCGGAEIERGTSPQECSRL